MAVGAPLDPRNVLRALDSVLTSANLQPLGYQPGYQLLLRVWSGFRSLW
jgi:hypothetical protein